MSAVPLDSTDASTQRLVRQVTDAFVARYGCPPETVVAAPGRVNLIGEHIDYNDGFVLPMAIERYVVIAGKVNTTSESNAAGFFSLNLNDACSLTLPLDGAPQSGGWSRYVEGVIAGMTEHGIDIPSLSAVIGSNVPLGSGLSSSAALEVAVATLIEALTHTAVGPNEKATLCQQAEHRYAGVPCGVMDQYGSVCGRAGQLMLLDCATHELTYVPFTDDRVAVLIVNSNVDHELASGEYARRRQECDAARTRLGIHSWREADLEMIEANRQQLNDVEYRRARHIVSETARTRGLAEALRRCDWARVAELMHASHQSLRDDFEVSCKELDLLVEIGKCIGAGGGVLGSRMTGGGFGGCTVNLIRSERLSAVSAEIASRYEEATGIAPQLFASRPAQGAHVVV